MEAGTQTQSRTLVKTSTTGWFIDAADPDGKRVRKTDDDRIISRDEFEALKRGEELGQDTSMAQATAAMRENAKENAVADNASKPKPAPQKGKTTTGKEIVGATTEIRCAWVDPDKRNQRQTKLFKDYFLGKLPKPGQFNYDKVLAAAGDDGGKPDGRKRVIKKQDAFQVRFHPDNVGKARNERRRVQKANAKAEVKKAAPAAA